MDISFATNKLAKMCNAEKELVRTYGPDNGRRIAKRILQMRAMATLADLMTMPQGRPHPLTENLKGFWAIDLKHPQRLLFSVANTPVPTLADGGIDTKQITKVCIVRIEEDYHG